MARSRESLTASYAEGVHRVRERTVDLARRLWIASPSLRDADMTRLRRLIVPRVQAAQIQVANLANAYVAGLARVEGVAVAPSRIDRDAVIGYRGVPFDEVYTRPAVEVYTSLSKGNDFETAKTSGLNRLLSIVSTDIQQARTRQSNAAYGNSGYEYTIRTLTGRENCALCVIASTQRYHKRTLMPIHNGCDCGQRGVKATFDPGQVIDQRLLDVVNDHFGGSGTSLDFATLRSEVAVHQHGEQGPVLTWRDHAFTGPDDLH